MITLPSNTKLPSRILEVQMKKFSMSELKLISASIQADDYDLFIDAVDAALPDVDVRELAIRDFYKLALVQRLECYPATPISFSWECTGVVMHDSDGVLVRSEDLEGLDPETKLTASTCGHENEASFGNISEFEEELLMADIPDFAAVPRVSLLTEYRKLVQNPQLAKIVPVAAWLKAGDTIAEKIELIGEDLDLFDQLSKLSTIDFGVKSLLVGVCSECGKKVAKRITVDNESFFR